MHAMAIDLGATSGRVARVHVDESELRVLDLIRFATPTSDSRGARWDFEELMTLTLDAARQVADHGPIDSVGIDAWGADYGLLERGGSLIGAPFRYRDTRTRGVSRRFDERRTRAITGLMPHDFSTAAQLLTEPKPTLGRTAKLLSIGDLVAYRLTGHAATDCSWASTTQLFDLRTLGWSAELLANVGIHRNAMPQVQPCGTVRGELLPHLCDQLGVAGRTPLVTVAGHDTASAIVATPAGSDDFIYISCGTWALVGVESAERLPAESALGTGFVNELGVDGVSTIHRNAAGLWLLNQCLGRWTDTPADPLLAAAAVLPAGQLVFDSEDPRLFAPEDMPTLIAELTRERSGRGPANRAEMVRAIIDSLVLTFVRAIEDLEAMLGTRGQAIHLVGGGAALPILGRALATAAGRTVLAGPVEASLLGNALLQARALGSVQDTPACRALVSHTQTVHRYEPDQQPNPREDTA
ncbi:rhamnulokinase [Occultella glacieicola]|uniref:Rhamnulokinase n=1 Tax=Occultella glacieicola TaxID=2518684 RepID=A0ABY2E3G6_9MICO|nr:FGGY-family carbohydrate kinase [Occultella glacieicola]TDE89559.1 rhamnulokinase [Occultella glacieicola]